MTHAMILAAGRGERLRPLTDQIPKPLVEVNGKPLIVYNIEKLKQIGITNIIINISYRADYIRETLGDGKKFDVNITYSYEPTLLDSGGGIFQALPLLGDQPFLVISSDIYTDYPFETLLKKFRGLAHLVLAPNPDFNLTGDYSLDKNGWLMKKPEYTFASFCVLNPALFKDCQPGKFSYISLINKLLENSTKQVSGEIYRGVWYNVGRVKELEDLRAHVLQQSQL